MWDPAPPTSDHRVAFRRRKRWLLGIWIGFFPGFAGCVILGHRVGLRDAFPIAFVALALVQVWVAFGPLGRCPACARRVPGLGTWPVYFRSARFVCDCGALLQGPAEPEPPR